MCHLTDTCITTQMHVSPYRRMCHLTDTCVTLQMNVSPYRYMCHRYKTAIGSLLTQCDSLEANPFSDAERVSRERALVAAQQARLAQWTEGGGGGGGPPPTEQDLREMHRALKGINGRLQRLRVKAVRVSP